MAFFKSVAGQPFTIYDCDTGELVETTLTDLVGTITDDDDTDPCISLDDWLCATFPEPIGEDQDACYLGTYDCEGEEYPVFQINEYKIVFGLDTSSQTNFDDLCPLCEDDIKVHPCFMAGTLIATPEGETVVEDLQIGDMIMTADGRTIPVKWIGTYRIRAPFGMSLRQDEVPVCIEAGTLGTHSDLYVSGDHGMIVEGKVINASALVNGKTVRFVPAQDLPRAFTYFHIETEAHDEILANGAPTETFVDVASRRNFDNYQEYLDLYGVERIIPEMARPRISAARHVPEFIAREIVGEDAAKVAGAA